MKEEIASNEALEFTPEEVIDPIEVIHKGECTSLSGRSTLDFAIGRHTEDGTLLLAITGNSGGGMWCKDWCSASDIQDAVLGESGLTAKSFHQLHAGRSINTGGFILAALSLWLEHNCRLPDDTDAASVCENPMRPLSLKITFDPPIPRTEAVDDDATCFGLD